MSRSRSRRKESRSRRKMDLHTQETQRLQSQDRPCFHHNIGYITQMLLNSAIHFPIPRRKKLLRHFFSLLKINNSLQSTFRSIFPSKQQQKKQKNAAKFPLFTNLHLQFLQPRTIFISLSLHLPLPRNLFSLLPCWHVTSRRDGVQRVMDVSSYIVCKQRA